MNSESNRLNPSGWKQASQLRHHLQSQQIDSPESELSNFDCYQNYTAPEVFVQHIAGIVNQGDVEIIVRAQKQMLQRFEKTNEMLLNCNSLSSGRLKVANDDFKKHIKLINDMKKDLDYIFKKIHIIKSRIGAQYSQAMKRYEEKSLTQDSNVDETASYSEAANNLQCKVNNISITKGPPESKITKDNVTVDYVQMEASTDSGKRDIIIAANEGKQHDESTDSESSVISDI